MTKVIFLIDIFGFLNHKNASNSKLFMVFITSSTILLRKYFATGIKIALL